MVECWRYRELGHFHCPQIENGQLFRFTGPPTPSPGPRETYCVLVRCQRGIHQAMVHKYPMVPVEIVYMGKNYRLNATVSSHLMHPLILRMNWPGFSRLIGQCVGVCSRPVGTQVFADLSGDMRSSDVDSGEEEMAGPSWETLPAPAFSSSEGGAGEPAGCSKSTFAVSQRTCPAKSVVHALFQVIS